MSFKETIEKHPSYLKKGIKWLCNKFNVTEREVEDVKNVLQVKSSTVFEKSVKVDAESGDVRSEYIVDFKPKSIDQLYILHEIDKEQYTIKNYWSKLKAGGKFTSSVFAVKNKEKEGFDLEMFVNSYIPPKYDWNIKQHNINSPASVIINKQDFHANKACHDTNSIQERCREYEAVIASQIGKISALHSLDEIVYIIGSDHFNSEYTGTTVKGTPQENIGLYTDSFREVCSHEVKVINYLLSHANRVKVLYLPGNHDTYVSFHMCEWLKAFFQHERIDVFTDFQFTKYFSLYDTAICINHGDVIKPESLALSFPIAYKEGFSKANHWAIFCGDKHTELTRDIGGIKFYRISAISKAKSTWDKQRGYEITKAESTVFVVEPNEGVNMILKKVL